MNSFLAALQLIGGAVTFLLTAKAVEAAVNREWRQAAWLAPVAAALYVTCVGLEARYGILLAVLVIGSFIAAVVRRRRSEAATDRRQGPGASR
jgi:hypothetical protein